MPPHWCLQATVQVRVSHSGFLLFLLSLGLLPLSKASAAAPERGADPAALEEGVAVLLTKARSVEFVIIEVSGAWK